MSILDNYEYKVALPPPSLYAQFNNLDDKGIVLSALLKMGFDDVFEVAAAAEMVSELTRKLLAEKNTELPIISSACPSIVRLIRVRFPNLIDKISPVNAPFEIAATMAAEKAMKKTGLPREKIGIIFITPCPAKVTAINNPLVGGKSGIDGAVAMSEIYPKLLPLMKDVYTNEGGSYYHSDFEAGDRKSVV